MNEIVYLNGKFLPKEEAWISPDDRGFIFADGVYEVVKYYNGRPFRFRDHLERLKRSLEEIKIQYNGLENLNKILSELLDKNNRLGKQAGVYLQITRGVNKRIHYFPKDIIPTIYAFSFDFQSYADKLENGVRVITHEDIRWHRCDIKSVALLPNSMLYNKAVESGADECLFFRNGILTEGALSSVFVVVNGTVLTHPLSNLVLSGVTRKVVLEICVQNNIPFEERAATEAELFSADEVFITGTGSEVTPVVQVDNTLIGNNRPGDITRYIQNKLFELVER